MQVTDTSIPDVKIITPDVFYDERGFFMESFNQQKYEELLGRKLHFVQDNHSFSKKNVLRGLHYQVPPMEQAKLIRVIRGEVFDVAVDLRPESSTYRQWVGVILSASNQQQLWIPEGFAHGFYVLSNEAECLYKVTQFYSREHEQTIAWNAPDLNIEWPLFEKPVLSAKDSLSHLQIKS